MLILMLLRYRLSDYAVRIDNDNYNYNDNNTDRRLWLTAVVDKPYYNTTK